MQAAYARMQPAWRLAYARMQPAYTHMQPAYARMQPACTHSVNPALQSNIKYRLYA